MKKGDEDQIDDGKRKKGKGIIGMDKGYKKGIIIF